MFTVQFNPEVVSKDVAMLTRSEEKLATSAVRRMMASDSPTSITLEDIAPFDEIPGYYRWKPSHSIKNVVADIRIVFTVKEDVIQILCVANRDFAYKLDLHARTFVTA